VPLANFDQFGKRRNVSIRAVESINGDQAWAMRSKDAVKGLRIVMAEQIRVGACAPDTFVQGDMGLHIQEDGAAFTCEGLDQTDICCIA